MVTLMLIDAEIRELLRKKTKHVDMKIQQQLSVTRNRFYLTSCRPLRDAETQVSDERKRKDKTRSTEQCERMTFTKRTSIEQKNRRTIKTLSYLQLLVPGCVLGCVYSHRAGCLRTVWDLEFLLNAAKPGHVSTRHEGKCSHIKKFQPGGLFVTRFCAYLLLQTN